MPKRNPATRSRRPPAEGRRDFRVVVRYSAGEHALIERAAVREGLVAAAWLGQAGLAAADPEIAAARAARQELEDLVRAAEVARRIGHLLNQAVARLHSTGVPGPELGRVAELTWRAVARLDDAALAVRRRRCR